MPPLEPTLHDFGLSAAEVQRFDASAENQSVKFGCASAIVLAFAIALIASDSLLVFIFSFVGLLAALGFGVAALSSLIFDALRRLADAKYRSYQAFKQARAAYDQHQKLLAEESWRSLSGVGFEKRLGTVLSRLGADVHHTPRSGDGGVDLILDHSGRRYLVQCKALAQKAGPAVTRELYGTLMAHKADGAILATLNGVTSGARSFAADHGLVVWDLNDILHMTRRGYFFPTDLPAPERRSASLSEN